MIPKKLIVMAGVIAMAAMIQTAQASVDLGTEASLAALQSTPGAYLTIDDKIFSGFSFSESGLSGFDPSTITVTAGILNGVEVLTYGGNMQLSGVNAATANLWLNYSVTATGGSISMIDQRYTGGALNGSILINETATSAGATIGTSQLSIGDPSDPNIYPNGTFDTGELDILGIIPPQTTLDVSKHLAFSIFEGGGQVSVSSVQQSFHQVPEPTTMIAGALLLLPFGASTLRILRKNRTA